MVKGVLTFTVEGCKGIDDDSWFNKADPYAIVACGSQKHKTPTAKGGGKNPVWNSEGQFNIESEDALDVRIFDHDTGFDDFMGQAKIPLSNAITRGAHKEDFPVLTKAGKQHGTITLALRFSPAGGAGAHGAAAAGHAHGTHDSSSGHKGEKKNKPKKEKRPGKDSSSSSSDSD